MPKMCFIQMREITVSCKSIILRICSHHSKFSISACVFIATRPLGAKCPLLLIASAIEYYEEKSQCLSKKADVTKA